MNTNFISHTKKRAIHKNTHNIRDTENLEVKFPGFFFCGNLCPFCRTEKKIGFFVDERRRVVIVLIVNYYCR